MFVSWATGLSGEVVDQVFFFILAITVFLLGLITFLMVYFVIRYRKKRNPQPSDIHGNIWLEIIWTIVPTLLVLAMFYYGLTGFNFLKKAPGDALKVKVIARQWSWLFEYENGVKSTELKVPVGKPVKLSLTSQDVIHGFYAPAFRIKQDVVPGMTNTLWFQPTGVGTFDVFCTQYCGLQHANMVTKIVVIPVDEFDQWIQKRGKEIEATKGKPGGAQLFHEKGCVACHSVDGTPRVGPTLKGLFGKEERVLIDGKEQTVIADEAFIRTYILKPNTYVVVGYPPIMPPQALTEDELTELVHYIKDLK
ncbi:MAG: cytochrome c oxidase subunit II [Syntrophaceae bacterium]|nr:cytochrome c oxidase subunit II [Syntrophaceae bacterium]